jgi:hypothetical protein
MRVTDLDTDGFRYTNAWRGGVMIEVHDAANAKVVGALVQGGFTPSGGNSSCTTDVEGTCMIFTNYLSTSVNRVLFTVSNVTAPGLTYQPIGSETSITVKRPAHRR